MAPSRDPEDEEKTVLSPDELDFASEERVAELEEGRFVIGADGPPNTEGVADARDAGEDSAKRRGRRASPTERTPDSGPAGGEERERDLTGMDVKEWVAAELGGRDSQYAYWIAAKSDDRVRHQQLASDDVGTVFDGLLLWYAQQVAEGTAVEEALGILLAESSIGIRYPVAGLLAYLDRHDLDTDDSIEDLLSTIRRTDGLVFPLRDRP